VLICCAAVDVSGPVVVAESESGVPVDDLDALLTALAEQLGEKVGDLDVEHERWRVLQRAVHRRVGFDLVFRAVGFERDQSMAGSVVTRVLEGPAGKRTCRTDRSVGSNHRRYCRNPADEIAIVRLARSVVTTSRTWLPTSTAGRTGCSGDSCRK
jgi:hypothetical protein